MSGLDRPSTTSLLCDAKPWMPGPGMTNFIRSLRAQQSLAVRKMVCFIADPRNDDSFSDLNYRREDGGVRSAFYLGSSLHRNR